MGAIRATAESKSKRSFSYLYAANVFGASAGTILSALFLIELLGLQRTLYVAAALNLLIALIALTLSFAIRSPIIRPLPSDANVGLTSANHSSSNALLTLLFLTGLTSMALEVVWVRQFTPFLGTVVYAFAAILCVYLLATFLGSILYRGWSSWREQSPSRAWSGAFWFGTGCV